jgi:SAM-dependent methyltransferase
LHRGERSDSDTASSSNSVERAIRYRVTVKIGGVTRNVLREAAGRTVAAAVSRRFPLWIAELRDYELELELNIHVQSVYISIALSHDALWKRYPIKLSSDGNDQEVAALKPPPSVAVPPSDSTSPTEHGLVLGCTSLKPSIAFSLCWLLGFQDRRHEQQARVVVEPMVGSGMLAVELVARFADVCICGDNSDVAVSKTAANLRELPHLLPSVYGSRRRVPAGTTESFFDRRRLAQHSTLLWDATALPLPSNSVDGIVSDLPFGKRVGTRLNNNKLYPLLLDEFARVLKKGGRASLLTADYKPFSIYLSKTRVWKIHGRHTINMGGNDATIFVLSKRYASAATERRAVPESLAQQDE